MNENENKGARLLDMYDRLSHGEILSRKRLLMLTESRRKRSSVTSMSSARICPRPPFVADAGRSSTTWERGDIDWYILPMST